MRCVQILHELFLDIGLNKWRPLLMFLCSDAMFLQGYSAQLTPVRRDERSLFHSPLSEWKSNVHPLILFCLLSARTLCKYIAIMYAIWWNTIIKNIKLTCLFIHHLLYWEASHPSAYLVHMHTVRMHSLQQSQIQTKHMRCSYEIA